MIYKAPTSIKNQGAYRAFIQRLEHILDYSRVDTVTVPESEGDPTHVSTAAFPVTFCCRSVLFCCTRATADIAFRLVTFSRSITVHTHRPICQIPGPHGARFITGYNPARVKY